MSDRVSDHFPDSKKFSDLLEAAENANPKGDAGSFVADLRAKYTKWGAGMFLSGKQKAWLERIAEDVR